MLLSIETDVRYVGWLINMSEEDVEMIEEEIDKRCPECSEFLIKCQPLDEHGPSDPPFVICEECGYGELY